MAADGPVAPLNVDVAIGVADPLWGYLSVSHDLTGPAATREGLGGLPVFRARDKITQSIVTPIHPRWLRCSSSKY